MRYQPIENHGIVGNMHSAALVGLDGSVDWLCLPRFDGPGLSLGLAASVPLRRDGDGAVAAFPLGEGQSATFVLRAVAPDAPPGRCPGTEEAEDWFRETVAYWQRWAARCTYRGRWRETVLRSALALKLLTYQPTGAIVAAPTTSPPGGMGGVRNWDYRYTWIRDAAFTVYAFLPVGFSQVAARFKAGLTARWQG